MSPLPPSSTLFPYTTLFRSYAGNRFSIQQYDTAADPTPPTPFERQVLMLGDGEENWPSVSGNETRSEEHTSELQSRPHLVCRLLLEKKKKSRQHGHTSDAHA